MVAMRTITLVQGQVVAVVLAHGEGQQWCGTAGGTNLSEKSLADGGERVCKLLCTTFD